MIEIDSVTVIYNKGTVDEKLALHDISLKVYEGEFLVVVGSNGAGKSTLLKLLVGDVKPFKGICKVAGRFVKPEKTFKMTSIVCQDPNQGVFPNLTVEENLILSRRKGLRGFGFGKIDRQSLELLASTEMGLEKDLKRKASKLSGGQKQALAMVMAVSSNPKLLLLDEHTAALDPKSTEKIMELTERINRELGTTIIMITHDMNLAEQFGTAVLIMEEGKICAKIDKSKQKVIASQLKAMIRSTMLTTTG
ncbi:MULTISPECIES: ATP-binding cassette domain-containing protein [Pseudothermotoga]|jgi:putative ABC transport system ATP-binding protein|uniref:ABC transporter related n=1 Tax=Pseudothermotoga lettingae (strain ATCC BAA-301 / DSM 14385 / NBRC 107922 / TMO) TaxID=416591 RepID=A8F6P0_PSELT|nr:MULTISPECIES: ATP-binding cassette domain-containing protein [Pseudothermotoga]ABV33824.1 ABC transporter related [Pseudothermotoga lettingae TMO]MDI3495725.1 putative tryptophan/tyrosine transport system ATP-binding protein [Pseudothermotoga sp.]MDK2884349.1 putative tryptophan/tyrosine transport system ATP-binding protein [Pseudothermotoga sp.]GLI49240.1 ABC transporter ATP-binding protein [Pseudothermotoga lettingae TMO]